MFSRGTNGTRPRLDRDIPLRRMKINGASVGDQIHFRRMAGIERRLLEINVLLCKSAQIIRVNGAAARDAARLGEEPHMAVFRRPDRTAHGDVTLRRDLNLTASRRQKADADGAAGLQAVSGGGGRGIVLRPCIGVFGVDQPPDPVFLLRRRHFAFRVAIVLPLTLDGVGTYLVLLHKVVTGTKGGPVLGRALGLNFIRGYLVFDFLGRLEPNPEHIVCRISFRRHRTRRYAARPLVKQVLLRRKGEGCAGRRRRRFRLADVVGRGRPVGVFKDLPLQSIRDAHEAFAALIFDGREEDATVHGFRVNGDVRRPVRR